MEQQQISDFYDEYSERQTEIGVNERLISLYQRLQKLGLRSDSQILELGCGVGAFTSLLSRKVKSGRIEAVDLSPKSVEIAQQKFQKKNINFVAADVVKYEAKISPDFVTLMDVIEHIPLQDHQELFDRIAKYSTNKTQICINIPNPDYIKYSEVNNPEGLQIIDQPVDTTQLVNVFEKSGLELVFFEKYSIWNQDDYHFFLLKKKQPFVPIPVSTTRSFLDKVMHKLRFKFHQLIYRS